LIDTLKAQAPTTYASPEAKAKAEADAKNKSKTPAKSGKN
jgi:hypothetical protein